MKLEDIKTRVLSDPAAFVEECDNAYHEKLRAVANTIAERSRECPVVLISGPSGSGKTTSAKLVERYLDQMGLETHSIAMDNYFLPLTDEQKKLLARNELDLESPVRMDAALLQSHLEAFRECREVALPKYHFPTSSRIESGEVLKRKKGELIIFEGIHSLNPELFGATDEFTSRVYVSVRTRVSLPDGHGILHPSKIRLARRMIRDRRSRSRAYEDTAAMLESVERGEQSFIMPYKYRAQMDIDTFIPYELCIYKNFLPENAPLAQPWLEELFELLHALPTLDPAHVASDSLIREFIGGGLSGE